MVTPPRQPGSDPVEPAHDEPTDAELIARSFDDPRAFMPLVDRHRRVLFGYLARRVGRDLAEDITSETFTRAFAQRRRFDQERDDARPWLFGIATNLLRNNARSEVRQLRAYTRHGVEDRTFDDHAGSDARLDAVSQTPALAAALAALKAGDREALLMFAWNDMSYEDIALALDIPVGTVRSRLNRARRIVQEHLAAADADPDREEATHGRP
ncbi:MAG: polymerase, sigma-24 subunit, subfamily [Thermoleophilia bacterium]|nr:polymerase, sigma-24 subunit, subfamily [Thermoleophilia bacterium]